MNKHVDIHIPGEIAAKQFNNRMNEIGSNHVAASVIAAFHKVLNLDPNDRRDQRVSAAIQMEINKNAIRDFVNLKYQELWVDLLCDDDEKQDPRTCWTVKAMFHSEVEAANIEIRPDGVHVFIPFDSKSQAMRFKLMLGQVDLTAN